MVIFCHDGVHIKLVGKFHEVHMNTTEKNSHYNSENISPREFSTKTFVLLCPVFSISTEKL